MMRTTTLTVSLLAASGTALAAPALGVDLSFKWREGVTLTYETRTELTQETASPFGNATSNIETTAVQTLEVVGVRRGNGDIEVSTESMTVRGDDGMGNRFSYDSENQRDRRRAADDPNIAPFAAMVGETFTMTLSPSGKLQDVEGHLAMVRAAGLTEAMFEAQLDQTWNVVPGDEAEIGQTWTTRSTQRIPNVGEITVELVYTFKEMDTLEGLDVAVIEVEGEATLGRGAQVQGMRVRITESSIEGVIHFAPDLGLIVESEQTSDLLMEISGQGQSIEQSISSSTFMELTDVEGLDLSPPEEGEEPQEPVEEPAAETPQPAPSPTPPPAPAPGSGRRGGKP